MTQKTALERLDAELDHIAVNISDTQSTLRILEAQQESLLLARSFIADDEGVKRLPAPDEKPVKRAKKSKSVQQEPKPRRPRQDVDTECPLDWELAGVSFTLKLNAALIMRRLTEGAGDEAEIVSQEALLDCLGRPHVQQMFKALRGLRTALYAHKTAHTVESVRGEGYRLVAEE